jgi:hypothetical protein
MPGMTRSVSGQRGPAVRTTGTGRTPARTTTPGTTTTNSGIPAVGTVRKVARSLLLFSPGHGMVSLNFFTQVRVTGRTLGSHVYKPGCFVTPIDPAHSHYGAQCYVPYDYLGYLY